MSQKCHAILMGHEVWQEELCLFVWISQGGGGDRGRSLVGLLDQ